MSPRQKHPRGSKGQTRGRGSRGGGEREAESSRLVVLQEIIALRWAMVAFAFQALCHGGVIIRVGRGDGRQSVHIAVVEAKERGDQDGVVDFEVGGTHTPGR